MTKQIAWITGAAAGIGEATSKRLASQGVTVLCTDIDEENAHRVAREINETGGRALGLVTDVCREDDNISAVQTALSEWGGLHMAVLNAGANLAVAKDILATTTEEFRASNALNYEAIFFGVKHAGQAMKDQGKGGAIVTTGSVASTTAMPALFAYGAAKHGAAGIVNMAACDLRPYGISVNSVAPGAVASPNNIAAAEEFNYELPPIADKPETIANAIVQILQMPSTLVTGQVIRVDHGVSNSVFPSAFTDCTKENLGFGT